jgi:hypothetical protein
VSQTALPNVSRSSRDTVDSGFGEEKKSDVKNEGNKGDSCTKTRNAGATACHRHFTHMGKQTEDGRVCHKNKSDNV